MSLDKKTAVLEYCNDCSEFELVMNIVEYLLDEVNDDVIDSLLESLGIEVE